LLLIALFAFIGAAMRTRRSITLFETLVVICALAGVGVAGHHVYTQFYPAVAASMCCNRSWTTCRWRRSSRWVSGGWLLLTPYPPILGLSLAQWALVAFVLVVVLVPLLTVRNRKALR
jgi:disulfide bond formation protein DsbB